jgi:TolB protein
MRTTAERTQAGRIVVIALALSVCSAPWALSLDGPRIAFGGVTPDLQRGMYVITPEGAGIEQLISSGLSASNPAWSHDGRRIAFEYSDGVDPVRIFRLDTDGGDLRHLSDGPWDGQPTWAPYDEAIAFKSARQGSDLQGVYVNYLHGRGDFRLTGLAGALHPSWRPAGDVIAYAGWYGEGVDIHLMDSYGLHLAQVTDGQRYVSQPTWHPREDTLAYVAEGDGENYDIHAINTDGTKERRLTAHPAYDHDPDWSPDGTQILFTSDRDGDEYGALFIMDLNGRNVRRVTDGRFIGIEGASWYDPNYPRSVSSTGRHATTWGWMKRLGTPAR